MSSLGCCKISNLAGDPPHGIRQLSNPKDLVIGFDVDGTLWLGSPAGRVTPEMVDSCRPIAVLGIVSARADAWEIADKLNLDFGLTGATDAMLKVKDELFPNKERYIHVADTYLDQLEAEKATWDFMYASDFRGCITEAELRRIETERNMTALGVSAVWIASSFLLFKLFGWLIGR